MNRILAFSLACTSLHLLTTPFANDQINSVQLRNLPPNGGNLQNGPEVVATVSINTEAGPVLINATDYDPAQHTLTDGEAAPAALAPAPAPSAPPAPPVAVPPSNVPPNPNAPPAGSPPPPAPSEKFVTKTGKKYFVTDDKGAPLDPAHPGYDTEAEAQAATKA